MDGTVTLIDLHAELESYRQHPQGNEHLKEVAEILAKMSRNPNVLGAVYQVNNGEHVDVVNELLVNEHTPDYVVQSEAIKGNLFVFHNSAGATVNRARVLHRWMQEQAETTGWDYNARSLAFRTLDPRKGDGDNLCHWLRAQSPDMLQRQDLAGLIEFLVTSAKLFGHHLDQIIKLQVPVAPSVLGEAVNKGIYPSAAVVLHWLGVERAEGIPDRLWNKAELSPELLQKLLNTYKEADAESLVEAAIGTVESMVSVCELPVSLSTANALNTGLKRYMELYEIRGQLPELIDALGSPLSQWLSASFSPDTAPENWPGTDNHTVLELVNNWHKLALSSNHWWTSTRFLDLIRSPLMTEQLLAKVPKETAATAMFSGYDNLGTITIRIQNMAIRPDWFMEGLLPAYAAWMKFTKQRPRVRKARMGKIIRQMFEDTQHRYILGPGVVQSAWKQIARFSDLYSTKMMLLRYPTCPVKLLRQVMRQGGSLGTLATEILLERGNANDLQPKSKSSRARGAAASPAGVAV
jgi:hypothetical protein